MKPKFEPTDDGLEIIDPIERHRYRLTTHESVDPEPVDTDRIQFPVASAVEVSTEMITLPTNESVYVRDGGGAMIAEVHPSKQVSLPADNYTLDLSGPLKVYALVEGQVYIYSDSERTYITFEESVPVTIGARSYHRRPAGTITTSVEPTDVMEAVSAFGSALKSTTPERSYPTHRGHPAAIKLGEELDIPEEIKSPDTGVQIEIPPTLRHVSVVTPLAYYLSAEVVPGETPQLSTKNGFTCDLEKEGDFEKTVEEVLKQIFFLDCIVRTEGSTPLPLYEREAVEQKLGFDIKETYHQKLREQIEKYLSVAFSTVEPYFPEWRCETHLSTTDEIIEFLPYIADGLSIVKIQEKKEELSSPAETQAVEDFMRNSYKRSTNPTRNSQSAGSAIEQSDIPTIKQSWNSINSSNIRSMAPLSAFHHSRSRTPREDPIEIEVVCNDSEMRGELEAVNSVYGVRKELPFDVTVNYNLKTGELEKVLAKDIDFVHFIGHIDKGGFECSNGKLDVAKTDDVGVKAFFLNACQSYKQGIQLVESGSIGGIVTLEDIINSGAIKVGGTVARLLNQGFPLYAALDVVRKENIVGQQYLIAGDGMTTIAQSETGPPFVCEIDDNSRDFTTHMETYTTTGLQKGSVCIPYLEENDMYFLTSGEQGPFNATEEQLSSFFDMGDFPVIMNGSLKWSSEILADGL